MDRGAVTPDGEPAPGDAYPRLAPPSFRFRFCPLCATPLDDGVRDAVNRLPRPTCPACGWVHYPPNTVGALVVVESEEGWMLIHPPGLDPAAPAALPGGIAEFAESPEECAVREVAEETGLAVELTGEVCRFFEADRDGLPLPFGPMLTVGFRARMVGGVPREGDEGPVVRYSYEHPPRISPARPASARVFAAALRAGSPAPGGPAPGSSAAGRPASPASGGADDGGTE